VHNPPDETGQGQSRLSTTSSDERKFYEKRDEYMKDKVIVREAGRYRCRKRSQEVLSQPATGDHGVTRASLAPSGWEVEAQYGLRYKCCPPGEEDIQKLELEQGKKERDQMTTTASVS